jgi:hypothetical protein
MDVRDWWQFFIHHWTITRVVRWAFLIGIAVICTIYLFSPDLYQYTAIRAIILASYFGATSLAYIMGWTLGVTHKEDKHLDKNEK